MQILDTNCASLRQRRQGTLNMEPPPLVIELRAEIRRMTCMRHRPLQSDEAFECIPTYSDRLFTQFEIGGS